MMMVASAPRIHTSRAKAGIVLSIGGSISNRIGYCGACYISWRVSPHDRVVNENWTCTSRSIVSPHNR
jgi:hypothetical protein